MKDKNNAKKDSQLRMSNGKASAILRKIILFSLIQKLKEDTCFRCGEQIEKVEDLSIEHKVPWLDSGDPVTLFFDIDNIAFSHLTCNVGSSRKKYGVRESTPHGYARYRWGCRCDICVKLHTEAQHRYNTSEKARINNREYQRNRYHTDPIFRENNLNKSRKYKCLRSSMD